MLFKRRDTRFWVLAVAGFISLLPLTFGLGTSAYMPVIQIPLAALTFAAATAIILRWRRSLPSDLDLAWIAPTETARLLTAPPPLDATLLLIAFERDWPRRNRLDILIDGRRVGQLPPGTGMLLTLQPGMRTMQVFLDRPRTVVSEAINSMPGGYAGFTVRNRGSRAIELEIRRIPGAGPPALGKHMRLVRPVTLDTSA